MAAEYDKHQYETYKNYKYQVMALHGTLVCDSENWCTY